MRFFSFGAALLAILLAVAMAQPHLGHGFNLSLSGNKIETDPENTPVIDPQLFVAAFSLPISGVYFTDHGAVDDTGSGDFNADDTFQIDFLGPLWYSNGTAAVQESTGLTLDATNQNPPFDSTSITGTSTAQSGFAISGQDAHEILWELSGGTVAPGVYGLAYRISGWEHGNVSDPYDPSDVLVVAFNTNGFTGAGGHTLLDAQTAVFAAAVPEPSAILQFASALSCLALLLRAD